MRSATSVTPRKEDSNFTEAVGWDGVIHYAIIGFFNAALYAAVGAVAAILRKKSD